MLTSSLFFLYLSFQPPPPKPNEPEPGVAEAESDNPLLNAQPSGATELAKTQDQPAEAEEQAVTLGSMDADQKYNLLVTLNNRGASVERVELVGQDKPGKFKFMALEHEGGYLGYLGLVESTNGLRVRVVPDGSPAALAKAGGETGLQVGDLLQRIDETNLSRVDELEAALKVRKPGESVQLVVERSGQQLNFQATLSQAPLDLLRVQPWLTEKVQGNEEILGLRTTIASLNDTKIPVGKYTLPALAPTLTRPWQVHKLEVEGGQGVEFRLELDGLLEKTDAPKLELVKRYRLFPASESRDGYLLDLEVELVNRNDQPVKVSLRQEGPSGLSLEGWWYSVKISQAWFSAAGHRDVAFADSNGTHFLHSTRDIYNQAKKNAKLPFTVLRSEGEPVDTRTLKYIGLDSQYFNASLMPHPDSPSTLVNLSHAGARLLADTTLLKTDQIQAANVGFWVDTENKTVAAGQSTSDHYAIFLGPKETHLLASHGLERTIEYGWFPWVAKPLGWILHFFAAIVQNYGLAIVLLTVCVRLALFPLGRRAAITGQRMQELQPEIKKINEKYQDMEKRARAMQELYAKHDFKPLAGCLPMFLQIPIFIGLYRCLSVDVSLRQEPLIPGLSWCANLAGPDQLYNWSGWMWEYLGGRGTGWLGPYLNILPLVTVALFLVQQQFVMPKATDPQTQMTQTMMKWMTMFMGVMFFKVPAGLCVYFITSSIWSLIERQIVKKTIPPAKTTVGSSDPPEPSKPNKPADRKAQRDTEPQQQTAFGKIREMLDKPAVRNSTTQRGSKKRKGK